MNRVNNVLQQFARVEHYRLHCAEQWADDPYKESVIASVCSTLERLERSAIAPPQAPICMVCEARKTKRAQVLMFPSKPKGCAEVLPQAA